MPSGGVRAGAGRKRKADLYESAIRKAERQIRDNLPMIVERMIELVDGVTVQETNRDGSPRIYTRAPDRAAGQYLMDRLMGKPVERSEVDANVLGSITVVPWVASE